MFGTFGRGMHREGALVHGVALRATLPALAKEAAHATSNQCVLIPMRRGIARWACESTKVGATLPLVHGVALRATLPALAKTSNNGVLVLIGFHCSLGLQLCANLPWCRRSS